MDSWVRFTAQSQGRERIFRAAQYACTLLSYSLQKSDGNAELVGRIKQLEMHMSLGRKLFRLGNSAEALESAKRSIHLSDLVLRFCVTVGHLNRAMYFACDNILWAGKVGLVSKMDQEKWSKRSFRYYLFALIMNLTRDFYDLSLLMQREAQAGHKAGVSAENGPAPGPAPGIALLGEKARLQLCLLHRALRANRPLLLDILKNACDLFIPLDKLGLLKTNPGIVGVCGLTSSALSILIICQPWLKLKP